MHALPLRLRGDAIGTLNLFHQLPGPLPAADLALGQALADVATIGILSERAIRRGEVANEQLQTALNSRIVIEQAKGVLAHHGNLGMDAAFDRLRRYARHNSLRLSDVARRVVDTDLATDVLAADSTPEPGLGDGDLKASAPHRFGSGETERWRAGHRCSSSSHATNNDSDSVT